MKKITLLILALLIGSVSYAQFPETFDTEIPATWAIYPGANGLGPTETWEWNGGGFPLIIWEDVTGGLAEDWLVSPQVAITAANSNLTFDVTDLNAGNFLSDITVRVSTMASQTNIPDFSAPLITIAETDIPTAQTFETFTVDLSSYIGSSIYIAFIMTNDDGDAWIIDNIDLVGGCLPPNLSFDDFTSNTADISMTSVSDYEVEWGEFPYTQGSGGSTGTVTAGNTFQLTGLMPGVSYNVFVRQNCGGGDFSNYSEILVGTSPDFSTLPLTEDLEPDANQALLVNFGLSFFEPTGSWNYNVDDTTDGDTTNDFANSGVATLFSNSTFTDAAADATVYIGPFDLTTANEYTFMFMQRNFDVASATRPDKDIEVVVATTNDGTTNTVIATFDDLNNTTYVQRTASFIPPSDGSYYFGVRDKTALLPGVALANSVFIDDISIDSQLSIDEFETSSFTYHYSKDLKTLSFESSNSTMTNIEIYSILGQNVLSKPLYSSSEDVNVASLNDGVYLARISIDGGSKTIKFIKN